MGNFFKIISGYIVVSDTSLPQNVWCNGVVKAENGDWGIHIKYDKKTNSINRMSAWHIGSAEDYLALPIDVITAGELPFLFLIDSGNFGYFDKDHYNNITATQEICTVLPHGIMSMAKLGTYTTNGIQNSKGNYIALSTTFVEAKIHDDYDDNEDDEPEEDIEDDEE